MTPPYILAIDQGTTSSRALVVGADGRIVGVGQQPLTQHYPRPGWVEHDPEEIWTTTLDAVGVALAQAGLTLRDVACIGVTNQRETAVAWERATGAPVHRAIVWQDRRTAGICEDIRSAGAEEQVRQTTGLRLDPYFTATKLTWLFRHNPELHRRAREGEICAGTVDAWLTWKLTGGASFATDFTNASRTLLFNVRKGRWDDTLLDLFEVPRAALPAALPSRSRFGFTSEEVFGCRVPIAGIAGDQQAALFGQGGFAPGLAKNTYGTGCFLLSHAGSRAAVPGSGLLLSLGAGAGQQGPEYVVEGSIFVAGALVQWLRDELGLIRESAEIEPLAASVPDSNGVTIVPAFTGLGAPDWDPHARGAILGLTRGVTRAHLARAALEAIALSSAELIEVMNASLPEPVRELRVDGGAAVNDLLMQLQADFAGIPVLRPESTETTALGAAYLAGLTAGVWSSTDEVAALWRPERVFEPRLGSAERHRRLRDWRRAVERTLGWAN
ncbi:MAG: glycerol kinase [Tepidiforma sp.]|nr:MAG: glycerol kinase [Tepidiforma sp.]